MTENQADYSRDLENPTSIPLTPVATSRQSPSLRDATRTGSPVAYGGKPAYSNGFTAQRTGSPTRREALISPPSLVEKGAGGLGLALTFPDDVKSQKIKDAQTLRFIYGGKRLGFRSSRGTRTSVRLI